MAKGPSKPWPQNVKDAAEAFVEFLKDSKSKRAVQDFLMESYKRFEAEHISRFKARVENQAKADKATASDFQRSGNIGPLLDDEMNMAEVEKAFVKSLVGTRDHLVKSIEDRVEEINRLLTNIGGFNAQLKSCFARSTVVFLEQEDPRHPFRERLIFSVNLPNYELKRSMQDGFSGKKERDNTGRTLLQITWDEAVNSLTRIVELAGLKPKYCKNDRRYGHFIMKQDLKGCANIPDEYFSFTLDYNTEDKIKEMRIIYNSVVEKYDKKLRDMERRLDRYSAVQKAPAFLQLQKLYAKLSYEKDIFIGTTPDPNQIEEGLLFQIEVVTLKDYHIVKDRMQSIMTRYILHLSKIDGSLRPTDSSVPSDELNGIPQYMVDPAQLSLKKRKAS